MSSPVVLITGCSAGGIGSYLAKAFHATGCRVVATARKVDSLSELAALGVITIPMDVTSPASIEAAVKQAIFQAGRIDILVNNAGLGFVGPLAEVDLAAARSVFDTNYWGLLAVTQAVVPHMAARGTGTIINIGSIAGWVPSPFGGIYSSSKAAVEALTHTLRLELKPFGLNVMLVSPGAIRSNIGASNMSRLDTARYVLYQPYAAAMQARAMLSQQRPTPTEDFAARVVDQALRRGGPPRTFAYGRMAGLLGFLSYLPRQLVDFLLLRRFGLHLPVAAVTTSAKKVE